MKKYFAQLRPTERRIVIGVGVVLIIVLNWAFVWPHFSDWSNYRNRLNSAHDKLNKYRAAASEIPTLKKQVSKFENEGDVVSSEDQGVNVLRVIQMQSAQSGVQLQSTSQPRPHSNDVFFVEQVETVNVLAPEANLVDFLYKLGNDPSMIRVRNLTLQPDPPRQRLSADIQLVASYQKNPKAPAAKTATAKAK